MRESSPAIPSSFEDVFLTTSMVSTILTLHFLLCKKRHHKEAENRPPEAYDLVMCFSCFVSRLNTYYTTTIYCKTYDVWRVKKLKFVGNWKWYLDVFAYFHTFSILKRKDWLPKFFAWEILERHIDIDLAPSLTP